MSKEKKDISNHIIVGMVALVIGTAGGYLLANKGGGYGTQTKRIDEIRGIIAEKGILGFNETEAEKGIINGYLTYGGDIYARYTNENETDENADMTNYVNTSPTAVGSGFEVEKSRDGNIRIVRVTKGMPADVQGLKADDVVTAINGVSVSEQGYEKYANKLLGKQDTEVTLTILRGGEEQELVFKRVNADVGETCTKMYGKTGYIKINTFNAFTIGQVGEALDSMNNASGVVVDLRNCPGGSTDAAIDIMSFFVESGTAVMTSYDSSEIVYEVEPGGKKVDVPLAVLVNGDTKSAAEISTAILKDNSKKCTIIGTRTFGKGVFQKFEELKSGGTLRYTAGDFKVDDRECWQGVGIEPDITIEMDSSLIGTDEDIQLKKALGVLE